MNVAYVTMLFPVPSETFAAVELRAVRAAGCSVSVHTLRGALADSERMVAERGLADMPVHYATPATLLRGLWRGILHPLVLVDFVWWVVKHASHEPRHLARTVALIPRCLDVLFELRRRPPDVVHLFWGHYPALVGYLARRHLPSSSLSIFLGAYDLQRNYRGTGTVARWADIVWTHARVNVSAIERLGVPRSAIRVVYRGVDTSLYATERAAKIPEKLVTAGRLNRSKGMDAVLETVARLRRHHPNVTLEILGEGPERANLERLAARLGIDRAVTFRGHVSHEAVRDAMAGAAVFILLSRKASERLPNVVKEAMAIRCVCVTTATPGIDELVDDGVTGYVVPIDAIDDAVDRVRRALSQPERAAAMGATARRFIVDNFDITTTAAARMAGWGELTATRRPLSAHSPAPSRVREHAAVS